MADEAHWIQNCLGTNLSQDFILSENLSFFLKLSALFMELVRICGMKCEFLMSRLGIRVQMVVIFARLFLTSHIWPMSLFSWECVADPGSQTLLDIYAHNFIRTCT